MLKRLQGHEKMTFARPLIVFFENELNFSVPHTQRMRCCWWCMCVLQCVAENGVTFSFFFWWRMSALHCIAVYVWCSEWRCMSVSHKMVWLSFFLGGWRCVSGCGGFDSEAWYRTMLSSIWGMHLCCIYNWARW